MQFDDGENSGDVTAWIRSMGVGDESAAAELWQYCFPRLLRYSRKKLPGHLRRVLDDEDVALSAFKSFCMGTAEGSFGEIQGRDELWKLLYCITSRKAQGYIEYQNRLKRGGGRVNGESVFDAAGEGGVPGGINEIADPYHQHESPNAKAEFSNQCQYLLDKLGDDTLQTVALLRIEGHSVDEIAIRLGCAKRSVERRLRLIRTIWQGELEPPTPSP